MGFFVFLNFEVIATQAGLVSFSFGFNHLWFLDIFRSSFGLSEHCKEAFLNILFK